MTRSHYAYTRRWLENRFARTDANGVFIGHMPIYGHAAGPAEPLRLPRLARALQILRVLDRTGFATFLDVGCAEGYLAWIVRERFGVAVQGCDLSVEACRRAKELFDVDAVACDAERLPFRDGAFDVVSCSEMIEHVEHPVAVLLELRRVAKRALVLTTEETSTDRAAIDVWLGKRCGYPHGERNRFHPDDLRAVLGEPLELWPQWLGARPAEPMSDAEAREWLLAATPDTPGTDGTGTVAVRWLDRAAQHSPATPKAELCDAVLAARVSPRRHTPIGHHAPAPALLQHLVCPLTHGRLAVEGERLVAPDGRAYPIAAGGIPMLHTRMLAPVPPPPIERIDDRERRTAVGELHARLALPDTTGRTDWRFDRPADRAGWRLGTQLVARSGDGLGWSLRATAGDPDLVGPTMPFATAEVAAFEIEMRLHNPSFAADAGVGQLFWICDDDVGFREAASVVFPVANDGRVHSYRVDPRTGTGWPADGDLVCVRLDPVDGPCELDLVAFRIVLEA